ncbi:hypothetical protein [Pulveribacter sp.]|uniref:hypothetical protein n=1 Tax=Pulveribacter sp. TaxID=2678893 RepID=UPI0028AD6672|nr:hypothetical protein [Pulveribacter sp.]
MYGFRPEKSKDQPREPAPKLGFQPRPRAKAEAAELPASTMPGRGFRPGMGQEAQAPGVPLGFRPGMQAPAATDALPGLGFQPHRDAMRAQALNQAPDSIPAMVKPGEFVLPPDTVHAMGGAEAVQGVVDATHTPAPDAALVPRGFKPRAFFAQGGAVEEERVRPNSFGDAAATTRDSAVSQIPTGGLKAPAADGSQGSALNTDLGRNVANTLSALPGAAAVPGAAAAVGGMAARALGASAPAVTALGRTAQAAAPYAPVAGGAAALHSAAGASSPAAPVAPANSPIQQRVPAGAQGASGSSGAAAVQPVAAGPVAAPPSNQVTPGIYNHGRGQYSDRPDGMGMASTFTGQPNAQNDAAAEDLARGFQPGMGRPAQAPGPGLGFGPGSQLARIEAQGAPQAPRLGFGPGSELARQEAQAQQPGFSGVIGQQSGNGNMWSRTPEQQRRDAEVQASSIHRPTAAVGANALRSLDAQDLEGVRGANALAQEGLRQDGGLQREGMQQQGANTRAAMGAAVDQQRVGIEGRKADGQIEAQGYANRAAAQQEQLRAVLADPKAPITQKLQAQRTLRAMAGKAEDNRFTVVPGGQEWDTQANAMRNVPARVLNNQTGQFVEQPGQGGQSSAAASPPSRDSLVKGQVYQTARGAARWNGASFDPV